MSVVAVFGGLVVGWLSAHRSRRHRPGLVASVLDGADRVMHGLWEGIPAVEAWQDIVSLTASPLGSICVRVVDTGLDRFPVVARRYCGPDGPAPDGASVVIPRGGAVVPFRDPRLGSGLVVTPGEGLGTAEVPRTALLDLADVVERFVRTGLVAGR